MKIIDSHVHIGDYERVKNILKNSIYLNKYRLYSAIDPNAILNTRNYLSDTEGYFAIPIVFKEIDIAEENAFLEEHARTDKKAIPVPLIEPNASSFRSLLYKEHFLIHDYENFESRYDTYRFLNENGGYLLIHCDDSIRVDYINHLHKTFPNMHIIIAHMGRNVFENYDFSTNIIDQFHSKDNIMFDTSTITNPEILRYGISKCGSERILYGSDFPYEKKVDDSEDKFTEIIYSLGLPANDAENIFYNNAYRIKQYCKKRGNQL